MVFAHHAPPKKYLYGRSLLNWTRYLQGDNFVYIKALLKLLVFGFKMKNKRGFKKCLHTNTRVINVKLPLRFLLRLKNVRRVFTRPVRVVEVMMLEKQLPHQTLVEDYLKAPHLAPNPLARHVGVREHVNKWSSSAC